MTHIPGGLLAIWSTIAPESETDYLHWLTREHVFERVGVPGFQSGRVLKRRNREPSEYLILYALDSAEVMSSAGYLERLNHPTPWTQRIMPTLQHFRRGGGERVAHSGDPHGYGGHIAIARFEQALPDHLRGDAGAALIGTLARIDSVVNVQVMEVRNGATSIATQEKSMRKSEEGKFAGLLLVESLSQASLDQAITHASASGGVEPSAFDRYELVFVFHAR